MRVATHLLISKLLLFGFFIVFSSFALAEQEHSAFDLYVGDDFKGLVPVTYSDDRCSIDNPSDLLKIASIDLKNTELLEFLSGEFELKKEKEGLAKLYVDPRTFRIVFIPDSKFLSVKEKLDISLVDTTADKSSFRSDIQYYYFDTSSDEQISQVNLLTNATYGRSWINSDLEFNNDKRYDNQINDISINNIFGRWHSSTGYIQSVGRLLEPSTQLVGASVRTEPLLFNKSEDLRGSAFSLYVPTRSRVEFYKNGALFDSQVLSSGYQEIDTSRFPQGSYYVDIVIKGLGGTTRERKFFAKSGFLTTRGAPQYRLDLGQLRVRDEILDTPYFQATGEFRLLDNIQLNLSSFGTDEKQTFVSGFNSVFGNFLITGAVSQPTKGDFGYAIGGGGSIENINFSGDYEKSEQVSIDELERIEFEQNQESVEKPFLEERLGSKGERYTFTVSKWFQNLELRYNYSYISTEPDVTEEQPTEYKSFGPTIRYRIKEDAKDSIYFELSSLKTNNIENNFALLTWQHRFAPWSLDGSFGVRNREGSNEPLARGIVQYDTLNQRSGIGIRARTDAVYQEQEGNSQETSSFDFRSGSKYGGLVALGNKSNQSDSFALGGNISIAKGNGAIATGPSGLGQSVLIVELQNEDEQALTDILIDGQSINKIQGSGRYILGVSPYQKFNIRIKPSETSPLTRYDTKSRAIVLYPGAVQTVKFKIEKVFLAIGKIVDKDGKALEYKRISGLKDYPLTEQDGYFQAEVVGNETLEIDVTEQNKCKVRLPMVKDKQYYYDFGVLTCN